MADRLAKFPGYPLNKIYQVVGTAISVNCHRLTIIEDLDQALGQGKQIDHAQRVCTSGRRETRTIFRINERKFASGWDHSVLALPNSEP